MAIRNDDDDYGWALPPNRRAGRDKKKSLHSDDELPVPDFKDTAIELAMTLAGIVGIFFLVISLVKVFAL